MSVAVISYTTHSVPATTWDNAECHAGIAGGIKELSGSANLLRSELPGGGLRSEVSCWTENETTISLDLQGAGLRLSLGRTAGSDRPTFDKANGWFVELVDTLGSDVGPVLKGSPNEKKCWEYCKKTLYFVDWKETH